TQIYTLSLHDALPIFDLTIIGRFSRTRICAHYCGFGPFCRRNWGRAMKRFLTVILSVVLFATVYSWVSYVPISQREPNVYYFGFFETFIFVIIYAGPIYFLAGLPLRSEERRVGKRLDHCSGRLLKRHTNERDRVTEPAGCSRRK